MKNQFYVVASFFMFITSVCQAQDQERLEFLADSLQVDVSALQEYFGYQKYVDSLETTFSYEYEKADLNNGMATITIPKGYKFLREKDAQTVLSDIWGNPEDSSVMGLLLKSDESPGETSYGIELTYSNEGYVKDDDAEDIDYDDLLEEMQNDVKAANPQRKELGYSEVQLLGWATEPFYDASSKKLHWAKELKFEDYESNTLNYNIRVLGRKGFINLNVIGDMEVLDDVKSNLDPILASVSFNQGYKYSEFDPDFDEVAAYGIGGLIAGKILAKAGFFALLLKFWKVIAIGAVALFAGLRKKLFGNKNVIMAGKKKEVTEDKE